MSVNIEMNYYDGSSYTVLTPMANFQNMNGNLSVNQIPDLNANKITSGNLSIERMPSSGIPKSQILQYAGNGQNRLELALAYINPCFIVGGRVSGHNNVSKPFTFGFFAPGVSETSVMILYFIDNGGVGLIMGQYMAIRSNTQLIFQAYTIATYKLADGIGNYETGLAEFNQISQNYSYLVIY